MSICNELRRHDPPRLPAARPRRPARRRAGRRPARSAAEAAGRRPTQAKSCILIWMDGGPTHYETFDPKPDAPAEIRGEFKPIATKVPGVQFSEHMTRLAGDRRQARDRPLDPPRPGEPRRRQPLHDDRRPAADPGRLRGVRQLPPEPRVGDRRTSAAPRPGCPPTSRCRACRGPAGRTSSARSTPRSSSPTTRTAPDFRVRDVALPRGLTGERFARPARPPRPRSTGSSGSSTRRPATRPWRSTSTTSRATT